MAPELRIHERPIRGFIVSDNGEGFHDENIRSFRTLDSEYKAKLGGRGVGRLLWLKAFSQVEVVSHYRGADGNMKQRSFEFTAANGVTGVGRGFPGIANRSRGPIAVVRRDVSQKCSQKRTRLTKRSDILSRSGWVMLRLLQDGRFLVRNKSLASVS